MTTERSRTRWICRAVAVAFACALLASVARFYHPGFGFTATIGFPEGGAYELPIVQAIPHYRHTGAAYDGQFYAQLAVEPLLRDPAIDRALDLPAYRARRILFSWTAYALGLGRPAWILQAYAIQNVLFWIPLAFVMTRWVRPETPRGLALWTACLFAQGLLVSIRWALLDGPSMLLIALAIRASEQERTLTSAAIVGIAGLGRETNLLAALGLPWPRGWRGWITLAAALVLTIVPLLVWLDYLRSIYRTTAAAGVNQMDLPIVVFVRMWNRSLTQAISGTHWYEIFPLVVIVSLTAQTAYLIYRRHYASPWWRIALAYALLMLTLHQVVWDGYPGAITRVTLPLAFGFNVLLAREQGRQFWPWFVAGNLHLIAAWQALPFSNTFG